MLGYNIDRQAVRVHRSRVRRVALRADFRSAYHIEVLGCHRSTLGLVE